MGNNKRNKLNLQMKGKNVSNESTQDQSNGQEDKAQGQEQAKEVVQASQAPVEGQEQKDQKPPVEGNVKDGEVPQVPPASEAAIAAQGDKSANEAVPTSGSISSDVPPTPEKPIVDEALAAAINAQANGPKTVAPAEVVNQGTKDSSSQIQTPVATPVPPAVPTPPMPAMKLADKVEVKQVPVAQDSTATPGVVSEMQAVLDSEKIPTGVKMALHAIQIYEETMKVGRPVKTEVGAAQQRGLYLSVKAIIEQTPVGDFKQVFRSLLKTVEANRTGCFAPHAIFRFLKDGKLNSEEINMFRQSMDMLVRLAPVAGRTETLRQTDIRKALAGYNPAAVDRVVAYFE